MRTTKKSKPDFGAISRRSMQRDFRMMQIPHNTEKRRETENPPEISSIRRVMFVGENSSYYKFRSQIVGKLVRLLRQSSVGGWVCEFVHDDDRQKLNEAAGWSETKSEYLLDCVKFK